MQSVESLSSESSISAADGVRVIQDGDVTHFVIEQDDLQPPKTELKRSSWWQRFKSWMCRHEVSPYAKIRDLSDPFDIRHNDMSDDCGGDIHGVEVGIKMKW